MVKDKIVAETIVGDCEDLMSASLLCDATDTLIDGALEDGLCKGAVISVVDGELTCFVVGSIVEDGLPVELIDMVLERLLDEVLRLLLDVLDRDVW